METIRHGVYGTEIVLANLGRHKREFGDRCARGLLLAGLFLQRESQSMVPVEFGPLRASAFTRSEGRGFQTVVTVGYTAAYALYVHEAVGEVLRGQPRPSGQGMYWDPIPQAQSKFLEKPVRMYRTQMRNMLRAAMTI